MQALIVSRQSDGSAEIFFSVQGEGASMGKPAVFLRLAECNLACRWCDTKYTWDWQNFDPAGQTVSMRPEDVVSRILKYECRRLVVTGGEPLVQSNGLLPLLEGLKKDRFIIEVETNGTFVPGETLNGLVDQWNVSPKLGSSGNPRALREVPECYAFFKDSKSSYFKFVVQGEDDLEEVKDLVQRYGLTPAKVILMPEARSSEGLLDRSRWLVEVCKASGYLFSTRLHILLWGDQRGK